MSDKKSAWPMWEKADEGGNAIPQESDLSVGMKWMLDRSLQNERDFWSEKCMQEIQNISISLGDRLRQVEVAMDNRLGEESISTGHIDMIVDQKLAAERTRLLAERAEQFAALAELRRDLGVQRDHEAMVAELRKDLGTAQAAIAELARKSSVAGSEGAIVGESMMEASLRGIRDDLDMTQQRTLNNVSDLANQLKDSSLQLDATQASMSDLRKEVKEQRESHDLQASSAKTLIEALRREIQAVQLENEKGVAPLRRELAHVQADQQKALAMQAEQVRSLEPLLRETVARSSGELSRGIDAMTSAIEKVEATLRAELKQEIDRIRAEVDAERSQADEFAGYVAKAEVSSMELARRVEENERKIDEMSQDQKTEIVALRARIEANVDNRDDQSTMVSSLEREQLTMLARMDDLSRKVSTLSDAPPVMPPDVAGMSARLEALERISKDAPPAAASAAPQSADASPNVAVTAAVAAKAMGEVSAVRASLDSTSREVTRLAESLAEERQERRQAVSELSRQVAEGGATDRSAATAANDKGNEGLRAELRAEVSSRIALAETRVSGLEVSMWTEVKRVATDLGARIVRLEGGSAETKLTSRMTAIEGEVRRTSLLVSTFLEERSTKREITGDHIEMTLRQALQGSSTRSNPDDTMGSQVSQDSTHLDLSRNTMSGTVSSTAAEQRTPSVTKALSVTESSAPPSQVGEPIGETLEEVQSTGGQPPNANSWLSGVKRLLNINTPADGTGVQQGQVQQMQPMPMQPMQPMQQAGQVQQVGQVQRGTTAPLTLPSAAVGTGGSTMLPIAGGSTALSVGGVGLGGSLTTAVAAAGGESPAVKDSTGKNRMPGDLKESLAGLMTAVQRTLREQEDAPEEMDVLTQLDQMRRDPSPMIGNSRRGLYAASRSPSRAHSPQVENLSRMGLSNARKSSQEPRGSIEARSASQHVNIDMSSGSNAGPAWAQPREGSVSISGVSRQKMRSESSANRRGSPAIESSGHKGRGSSSLPIGGSGGGGAVSRGQSVNTPAAPLDNSVSGVEPGTPGVGAPSPSANVRSPSGNPSGIRQQAGGTRSAYTSAYTASAQQNQAQVGYTPQVSTQVLRARGATPLSNYTPAPSPGQPQSRSVRPSM